MTLNARQLRQQPSPRFLSGHDEIAAILGSEILSGTLAPGSRLPSVAELFDRFGISRVMVREVMKTLAAKGMIASKSRVGTHILEPSHWNWFDPEVLRWRVNIGLDRTFLAQLADMRRAVEPQAAALAAQHRTEAHLEELHAAVRAMQDANGDRPRFAEADLGFHIAVGTATANPLFRSFASVVEAALSASFTLTSPADPTDVAEIVARHAAIVAAIEARDPMAAALAMVAVIDEGFSRIHPERSDALAKDI